MVPLDSVSQMTVEPAVNGFLFVRAMTNHWNSPVPQVCTGIKQWRRACQSACAPKEMSSEKRIAYITES